MKNTRIVKFNIKSFIDNYILAVEVDDSELLESTKKEFKGVYSRGDSKVRDGMRTFVMGAPISSDYPSLLKFVKECE